MSLSRGLRNNNPLNIVKGSNWIGERPVQTDKRFEEFESLEMGLRAGFVLLRHYIEGTNCRLVKFNTIRKIINRWAPKSENDTRMYIRVVSYRSGILPDEVLKFSDRSKLVAIVKAMCFVECAVDIDEATIQSAYDLV